MFTKNTLFEKADMTLKTFAQTIGGTHSRSNGVPEAEIRYSKSAVSKWVDSNIVDPLAILFGSTPEDTTKAFDRLIRNSHVDYQYKNWCIKFHARNSGMGFETAGQLGVRLTCPIDVENFLFKVLQKSWTAHPPEKNDDTIPDYLKALIPEGILKSLERELSMPMILIESNSLQLNKMGTAESNQKDAGESLLNDTDIQRNILALNDVFMWTIGYPDWKIGAGTCIEITKALTFNDTDELICMLELAKSTLDKLVQLGPVLE